MEYVVKKVESPPAFRKKRRDYEKFLNNVREHLRHTHGDEWLQVTFKNNSHAQTQFMRRLVLKELHNVEAHTRHKGKYLYLRKSLK